MEQQNTRKNRRSHFRRYSDRRVAALLELHEILFYDPPGPTRDATLLNVMNEDYQTDRIAVVQLVSAEEGQVKILAASDSWRNGAPGAELSGSGLRRIIQTHREFNGALTLSKFRASGTFENGEWSNLWDQNLGDPASALLSVPILGKDQNVFRDAQAFLWLVVDSGSREWSSHDRDLSEEEAVLLARVLEQNMLGNHV